jgi:uncharacterized membrane protein HdeD (DUF308 family)
MTTTPFTALTGGRALWWNTLIGGVAAIVIGVLLLTVPVQALAVFAQLIGIYWLVTGVVALVSLFVDRSNWGWKLLVGVVGVLAGLAIVQHPIWATIMLPASLVLFMGAAGIVMGVSEIVMAFMGGGLGAAVLGVLSLVFGALLLSSPFLAAAALPFVLGIWGIVGGAAAVVQALRDRPAAPATGAAGATRQAA